MKKVECYRTDNGHLESSLDRAAAHDLEHALPKSATNPNAKLLGWNDCLRIMEHADLIAEHVNRYIELRDAEAKALGLL